MKSISSQIIDGLTQLEEQGAPKPYYVLITRSAYNRLKEENNTPNGHELIKFHGSEIIVEDVEL